MCSKISTALFFFPDDEILSFIFMIFYTIWFRSELTTGYRFVAQSERKRTLFLFSKINPLTFLLSCIQSNLLKLGILRGSYC